MEIRDQLYNVRKMAAAESTRKGRIVTVTSGKGGVGKTNIALNLSIALAQLGKSVTLFDTDTHLSNLNILLGVQPAFTLADVVFGDKRVSDVVFRDASGVQVVSGGSGAGDLVGLEDTVKERLFQEIFRLCHTNDFILVDTSAGVSEFIIDFALRADEVVVVTTPEPTAVSDAYALVKILFGRKENIRFKTLINRVKSEEAAEEIFERFSLVVEHFLKADSEYLGCIVEDEHVQTAVQKQSPFLYTFPKSKASKCIDRIARRMVS